MSTSYFILTIILLYFIHNFLFIILSSMTAISISICTEHLERKNFPPGINKVFWFWFWNPFSCFLYFPSTIVSPPPFPHLPPPCRFTYTSALSPVMWFTPRLECDLCLLSCVRNSCVVTVASFILIGPWQRFSVQHSLEMTAGLCRRNQLRKGLRVVLMYSNNKPKLYRSD